MPRRPNPHHTPTPKQIQTADEFIEETVQEVGGAKALDFAAFVAKPKKRSTKRSLSAPRNRFEDLLKQVNVMRDSCAWATFEPKHFVGLYCLLHQHVYGVIPEEVRGEYAIVVGAASRCLRMQFGGSNEAMVDFMRWTWTREKSRLPTRSEEDTFRIGWRYQFGQRLVTDFRTHQLRRQRVSR